MKLISSAIVYKAEVPAADLLKTHLEENPFIECGELQTQSVGFISREEYGPLVETFEGGFAWTVRVDQKIVPGYAKTAAIKKAIEKFRNETGRSPGKQARREIKEDVMTELIKRATAKTVVVTCYYDIKRQYLIVPASKAIADIAVSALVHAVGTVKTETLNISGVKKGLTARLRKWLDGDDYSFGDFYPHDTATLSINDGKKRTISVRMGALSLAREALTEATRSGFQVDSLGFIDKNEVEFRLKHDFRFSAIVFPVLQNSEVEFSEIAAIHVDLLGTVVDELCDLMAYKADEVTPSGNEE